jgi:hypothetical protein
MVYTSPEQLYGSAMEMITPLTEGYSRTTGVIVYEDIVTLGFYLCWSSICAPFLRARAEPLLLVSTRKGSFATIPGHGASSPLSSFWGRRGRTLFYRPFCRNQPWLPTFDLVSPRIFYLSSGLNAAVQQCQTGANKPCSFPSLLPARKNKLPVRSHGHVHLHPRCNNAVR